MGKLKDHTGEVHEHFVVISHEGYGFYANGRAYHRWLCRCECGKEFIAIGSRLNVGLVKSCGCLTDKMHSEVMSARWAAYKAGTGPWPGRKTRPPREK